MHSFFGSSTVAANDGLFSSGSASSWGNPNEFFKVVLSKWNGFSWQEIGRGRASEPNGQLSSVCGGSPYHQFNIYVGSWNAGPGQYKLFAYPEIYTPGIAVERTYYR